MNELPPEFIAGMKRAQAKEMLAEQLEADRRKRTLAHQREAYAERERQKRICDWAQRFASLARTRSLPPDIHEYVSEYVRGGLFRKGRSSKTLVGSGWQLIAYAVYDPGVSGGLAKSSISEPSSAPSPRKKGIWLSQAGQLKTFDSPGAPGEQAEVNVYPEYYSVLVPGIFETAGGNPSHLLRAATGHSTEPWTVIEESLLAFANRHRTRLGL